MINANSDVPLTNSLSRNRRNIAKEKDLGKPLQPNHRELFGFEEPDEAPKHHVDGGGVERRTEQ